MNRLILLFGVYDAALLVLLLILLKIERRTHLGPYLEERANKLHDFFDEMRVERLEKLELEELTR